ncbi:hypothetical protein AB0O76_16145 [Streptomyces sp. NPDC086554]|uniref:hypothetical protein n=1 Tax=Streptomyces sp. NPDC086554 TaxID=3154864 RepID=UPI003440C15C
MSIPPQPQQSPQAKQSPWAATSRPQGERVTNRLRRIAEGLPDWEPLPPGETVVRRPGSTGSSGISGSNGSNGSSA